MRDLVLAFAFVATLTLCADTAGADEPRAPSQEQLSLDAFAKTHPDCHEWSDGCTICVRDGQQRFGCSVPGIACQPQALACR